MPDVVNDVLALAQFITNSRSEEQSVAFLLAFETLTIESWRTAKKDVGINDNTNHRTKEAFIKEVVSELKNNDSESNYCMRDLSLCPGFSTQAIELIYYSSATVYCVKKNSSGIADQRRIMLSLSRTTAEGNYCIPPQQQQQRDTQPVQELSPTEYPALSGEVNKSSAAAPSGWNKPLKSVRPKVNKTARPQKQTEQFTV